MMYKRNENCTHEIDLCMLFCPQIDGLSENDVMSYALYPHVAKEFFKFRNTYGPVDKLETRYT